MDINDLLIKAFAKPPWHLIAAMFIALGFYVLDAWVLFLPVISFAALALILPCFLLATILCLFRRLRPRAFQVMRFIGVLFLGVVAAVGTVHLHKRLTQYRAVKLGQACQAYRAKYRHYPERLDDLVPEFAASVPPASTGIFGDDGFGYSSHDGPEPFIYYNCLPPFGHCYYYVESRCWMFLD